MTDALKPWAVGDLADGPAVDAAPDDAAKACWSGSHRARSSEQTLRWIEPLFPVVGITRMADVTAASASRRASRPGGLLPPHRQGST